MDVCALGERFVIRRASTSPIGPFRSPPPTSCPSSSFSFRPSSPGLTAPPPPFGVAYCAVKPRGLVPVGSWPPLPPIYSWLHGWQAQGPSLVNYFPLPCLSSSLPFCRCLMIYYCEGMRRRRRKARKRMPPTATPPPSLLPPLCILKYGQYANCRGRERESWRQRGGSMALQTGLLSLVFPLQPAAELPRKKLL